MVMKINIGKTELIHFVGIGGIGMSGLALIMDSLGFKIQGSDISDNKYLNNLRKRNSLPSKCATKNCLQESIFTQLIIKINNIAPVAYAIMKMMTISSNALLSKNFEMRFSRTSICVFDFLEPTLQTVLHEGMYSYFHALPPPDPTTYSSPFNTLG